MGNVVVSLPYVTCMLEQAVGARMHIYEHVWNVYSALYYLLLSDSTIFGYCTHALSILFVILKVMLFAHFHKWH